MNNCISCRFVPSCRLRTLNITNTPKSSTGSHVNEQLSVEFMLIFYLILKTLLLWMDLLVSRLFPEGCLQKKVEYVHFAIMRKVEKLGHFAIMRKIEK